MRNAISKAAILARIRKKRYTQSMIDTAINAEMKRLAERIQTGTFDIPTDKKRCHLCPDDAETCYCYDDKPSVDADVKEIESALKMADAHYAGRLNENASKWLRQLLAKLAEKEAEVERLKGELDDAYNALDKSRKEFDYLDTEAANDVDKLNQAVEALEEIAGDERWITAKTAKEALQSIKGDSHAT